MHEQGLLKKLKKGIVKFELCYLVFFEAYRENFLTQINHKIKTTPYMYKGKSTPCNKNSCFGK